VAEYHPYTAEMKMLGAKTQMPYDKEIVDSWQFRKPNFPKLIYFTREFSQVP